MRRSRYGAAVALLGPIWVCGLRQSHALVSGLTARSLAGAPRWLSAIDCPHAVASDPDAVRGQSLIRKVLRINFDNAHSPR